MSFNLEGTAQAPLNVYGGLVTEAPPPTLPEGVSPDCQDVVFAPGVVSSRPAIQKVFASQFASQITSAKSFINPDALDALGQIENLYLDAGGNLWGENVLAAPGVPTLIASNIALNSYMKAVTAFGRQYIAITDGLHGSDVPLQWDGTYLDRVTQDGPGTPPVVTSIALPSAILALQNASVTLTVVSINYTGGQVYATVTVSAGALGITAGNYVVIAGNSFAPFTAGLAVEVLTILSDTSLTVGFFQAASGSGVGGTLQYGQAVTLNRQGNVVTAKTATVHNLQVGYQVQITKIPTTPVGGGANAITSIVINNEDLPGVATVTTTIPHGLIPQNFVSITGVNAVVVGTAIGAITNNGAGIVQVTTTTPHGLNPGSVVQIAATGVTQFNNSTVVAQVIDPLNFTYLTADLTATSAATGTVSLAWPIPATPTPQYFQVLSAPTATTFQIQIDYVDGTWTNGTVNFGWDGIFYVTKIISPTIFQYQQYGPNATSGAFGTVTPFGQAAPGKHQCQVFFITRAGHTTAPSPPVTFEANGGQYISVTNIPTGPPNVVARALAFTGAEGAFFFYIPVPAQVNGIVVSTATQINDNTTTSALLDFSDNTLFAALGTTIPGNNLAAQIVLDGALGFGYYASRILSWGQRNRIQNLLNMGFDGGQFLGGLGATVPTGWIQEPNGPGGTLVAGRFEGQAFQFGGTGNLYQSGYLDGYGAPILEGNTQYRLRGWVKGVGATVTITVGSATTGFNATATLTGTSAVGSFVEAAFTLTMPTTIPPDMLIILTGSNGGIVDELSIIFNENQYTETVVNCSYANDPEGFDGVTGQMGSTEDAQKIMGLSAIHEFGVALTQDPNGRLHEFNDNGTTEPVGWQWREVGTNCGLISVFAMTESQADSGTASGGEQWIAWASFPGGARIFGGGTVMKISQEIEPDWRGAVDAGASEWSKASGINPAALTTAWVLNDPAARVIYFGLPITAYPV